jgi:hypothetical protein
MKIPFLFFFFVARQAIFALVRRRGDFAVDNQSRIAGVCREIR